ncbi:MAG TPA: histidine kinase [Alloacidobacterium sp.]|nr:histidine kinase [Alloacidobacterium sp.]
MNSLTATSDYTQILPVSGREAMAPADSDAGMRLNGHLIIFSLAMALALATAIECQSVTHLPSLTYGILLWGWWGLITSAIWKFGPRLPFLSSFSPKIIALHVFAGSALGVAHLLLLGSLCFTGDWQSHGTAFSILTSMMSINRFGIELLIYGFVFGITGLVQFQIRAQRDAIKSLELQRQLSAAHLQALQMQLEPHFLFNTLNAITTLVELGRSKEAVGMLSHLNVILKSTLKRTTPEKVPLSQELEIVENYLAIEQARFADRLCVEIKVEPGALDGLVPCFLLQPILENAIRHGIARRPNGGEVAIRASAMEGQLRIEIENDRTEGQQPGGEGHGLGLANTRTRLEKLYGEQGSVEVSTVQNNRFLVLIRFPLTTESPVDAQVVTQ